MKDFLKAAKFGTVASLVFLLISWFWFYIFIKARTSTNPNLADSDTSAIYVWSNETLTAAKRNTLASRTKPIVCYKNWSWGSTTIWNWYYTFTAADCWWTLPDTSYVWAASYISVNWCPFSMFQVLNSWETWGTWVWTGPWVFVRVSWTPNWSFQLRVIYIKK
mgnify:CR=1 FL=1